MHDTEILARTLYGEARAHDTEDAEAIACVVMNRVAYRNWPGDVGDVCLQPFQFSCWNANDPNRARILKVRPGENPWFDECWRIAEAAIADRVPDQTRASTHYHTPAVAPRWSRGKRPVYRTVGHLYFNDIDTPAPADAREALAQERPLATTRTAAGGAIAGGATVGGVALESARDAMNDASGVLAPFHGLLSSETVAWALAAAALAGIVWMLWARYDDRRQGMR